jgi:pilus assembly protein CpaE
MSKMIPQFSAPGRILIVGAPDILTTFQFTSLSPLLNAVAASAPTLHDLVETADAITAKHDVVLFETDVSDDDLAALAHFVTVAQGQTKFIALVDDRLPLTKVRLLGASGADDILPLGIKAEALIQALADVAGQPDALDPQGSRTGATARVFSIAQSRGGAGATTIAVNIAASLAAGAKRGKLGPRVLLLDLDLQFGNAGTYLDIEDNGGLYDLLGQDALPSEKAILGAVQTSGYGVDVLTAPTVFVPLNAMSPEFVAHMIGVYRYAYDYLIIDLPRATMDWLAPVIMATDRLIMVSDSSVPCIRQAKRLIDLYRENRLTLPVELVINREKKTFFGSETIREAEAMLDLKVTSWVPDDPGGERRAIDLGRPTAAVRSKGRKTYRSLAKRLSATAISSSYDFA